MRVLVAQAQYQDEVDELNRAIRAVQAIPMADPKKSKKATDDLLRKLKVADDRFYKRI